MSALSVSVVIPTWNEAARVGALVRALSRDAAEVIVADGGSPDGTAQVAADAGATVLITAKGRGAQLRAGAAAATGEVVWMVHADASPPDGAITLIKTALLGADWGAFKLHTVDDGGPRRFGRLLRVADLRSRYTTAPYGDQAIFVRRSLLEAIGGVPDQPLLEDLALSLRLRARSPMALLDAEVRVSGRRFAEAPLRSWIAMWLFPSLWRLGVPAERLADWYRAVR